MKRRFISAGMAAVLCMMAPAVHAQDAEEDPGTYFVRLSVGWGGHTGSEHADLMAADGYQLEDRLWVGGDFAAAVSEQWFVGGWGSLAWAEAEARHAAPNLEERTALAGLQAPFLYTGEYVGWVLSPRLGVTANKLQLYDEGEWAWGPAAGLDVGLILVNAPLGLSVGYLYAPTAAPSELGRTYDAGGVHILLSGVIDDL